MLDGMIIITIIICRYRLPRSLFESICGMLNRDGGHIFLGVNDEGKIIGVEKTP